ncbi:hypothetical protein DSAG12_00048 [Promethearchaeum syntrophicum]|uniref:Uncharacterized protein n=1 Tax=Promethearchaeum syntrophicum TaxID=2594042 RepID=A0A5B9D619_9ARCH|nr:hypothetical protein [Candidatus Prometheoarchaeum syntrophicum]QEE14237.1 hypothetical protein DSAG12_00048 [Candidatus Prometheoarchaeum syntrophicum]
MSKSNKFSANISEKQEEFQKLLEKFNNMDDPIERYMKRQEMCEIKDFLSQFDILIEVP